jgi:uncharacterized repeat protein (TIGR01451 family)
LPYLDIAQQGTIYIIDSTKCIDGLLGLAQCTKATVYPQTTCSNLTWNGADINASGFCNNGIVHLSIFNEGANNMTDSVSYMMYLDSINVTTGNIMINAGDTINFQVAANGQSFHLHLNQVNNHPAELFVTFTQEACSNDSLLIPTSIVNSFPNAQQTGSKTHCLPIIGAYDPNDKSVVPKGFTANNIVPINTRLEYLIRFQNTGTDTAFNVLVVDTLSNYLNPESIEMGASSHLNTFTIQTVSNGKNVLKWQFNNINLPDSNTNLLGSNGFVQFRVSPKDSLPFGTIVRNKGLIYFDYNPAIITNNTITTFNNTLYTDSSLNELVFIVPPVPVLITPFDNAVNVPTLTSFNWESVPYATWYQLEFDNSINFSTSQGDTCALNQYLSPSQLDDLTTYYWRVKAFNGNSVSSAWSHVNIFTTENYTGTLNLTNDQIKVFPNPAKNGIFIIANDNRELQIEITDLSGRIFLNAQINNQSQLYLPLNLAQGLYQIKVKSLNNTYVSKLIIE